MIYERIILLLFLIVLQNGMQPCNTLIIIYRYNIILIPLLCMHAPMSWTGVNGFTIYDTRLGSSSTSPTTSGRVEVLTQRGWMPVCDSYYSWDSSESRVLCRQLGYTYSSYGEDVIAAVMAVIALIYIMHMTST